MWIVFSSLICFQLVLYQLLMITSILSRINLPLTWPFFPSNKPEYLLQSRIESNDAWNEYLYWRKWDGEWKSSYSMKEGRQRLTLCWNNSLTKQTDIIGNRTKQLSEHNKQFPSDNMSSNDRLIICNGAYAASLLDSRFNYLTNNYVKFVFFRRFAFPHGKSFLESDHECYKFGMPTLPSRSNESYTSIRCCEHRVTKERLALRTSRKKERKKERKKKKTNYHNACFAPH